MLCTVITGPKIKEALNQIHLASSQADLLEFRLDLLQESSLEEIKKLKQATSLPVIFTLRPESQGGKFIGSENARLYCLEELLKAEPEFVDLEYTVSSEFVKKVRQTFPKTKIIVSYHNFEKTPDNIAEILAEMQTLSGDYYKVAVMACSTLDTLRLASFSKKAGKNVIAVSMGEKGQVGRILSPLLGNPWTYASLDESLSVAPGQLSLKALQKTYRHNSLGLGSSIYGLIGGNVEKSIGHLTHNEVMKHFDLPSVYVKMNVLPEELKEFFRMSKELGVGGLSVTMPLKEAVISHLDAIDETAKLMNAVNTIVFRDGCLKGYNTDGKGALDAIENVLSVKGKRLLLIGAGGAAKAVAYEALQREAQVVILNRDGKRAVELAEKLGCRGGGLDRMPAEFQRGYDILVNATPNPMPIDASYLLSTAVVMDLTSKPKDTDLLLAAKAKGCRIIYGYNMFFLQAVAQFEHWFEGQLPSKKVFEVIAHKGEAVL